MSNEWFDVAVINGEIYILHGQIVGKDGMEQQVYVTMNHPQMEAVDALQAKQDAEMKTLLRSMVPA
jgi:hypothetical protein